MEEATGKNMGTEREYRLLFKMAVPIAMSMLVQALYNIVDSAFVGQISEEALSAVSVVFPFQTLFAALNVGIGVGMSQIISLSIGRRQAEKARQAAGQGFFLALCCAVFFQIFGIFFSDTFFHISGVTGRIAEMGREYLQITTVFSLGIFSEFVLERMLMSMGHTGCTMTCQIVGALLNLILDPLLIFGCAYLPAMGVKGAAIATVTAQHAAAVLAWCLHKRKDQMLQFSVADVKPNKKRLGAICSVGISAAVKQGAASVVLMFVNAVLIQFSTVSTAVYGAFNRLYVLFLTPTWAVQDVLVILAAYNLGIRNKHRIRRLFVLSMCVNLIIALLGVFFLVFMPLPMLKIFGAKASMLELGKIALPILACFLPFQAAASTVSAMLQGLGEGKTALAAGLAERFIFPLLLIYAASKTKCLNLVWWSFTVAEILGLMVSAWFMRRAFCEKISTLPG